VVVIASGFGTSFTKAWASALRVTVTNTATQKATVESMVRLVGSSKKGTGQALAVDIRVTLILYSENGITPPLI